MDARLGMVAVEEHLLGSCILFIYLCLVYLVTLSVARGSVAWNFWMVKYC